MRSLRAFASESRLLGVESNSSKYNSKFNVLIKILLLALTLYQTLTSTPVTAIITTMLFPRIISVPNNCYSLGKQRMVI